MSIEIILLALSPIFLLFVAIEFIKFRRCYDKHFTRSSSRRVGFSNFDCFKHLTDVLNILIKPFALEYFYNKTTIG